MLGSWVRTPSESHKQEVVSDIILERLLVYVFNPQQLYCSILFAFFAYVSSYCLSYAGQCLSRIAVSHNFICGHAGPLYFCRQRNKQKRKTLLSLLRHYLLTNKRTLSSRTDYLTHTTSYGNDSHTLPQESRPSKNQRPPKKQ